jgi:hypothetical protein
MNGLIPPPDPLGIPSPPFVFQSLAWLTFVLHLIFMNYVLGGTIIVTLREWLYGKDETVAKSNHLLVRIMPFSLSFAITMGVAPLLFVQVLYGQFFYSANVMMGGFWFSIIGLVMAAFYILYIILANRPSSSGATLLSKLLLLVNTVLFLCVAFLYTNNATLVENPAYWPDIYAGVKSVIAPDPSLIPRYLHNVIGAVAIAGLWIAVIGGYQLKFHPDNEPVARSLIRTGLLWATIATVVEIVSGGVYLYSLGLERISLFMGNGFLFVAWAISVVTAILCIITLIMALINENNGKFITGSVVLFVITLVGMVMGRDLLRVISLKENAGFSIDQWIVIPSTSSLVFFLITFVLGLFVIGYLVYLAWSLPSKDTVE